eukprot:scaffold278469_cov33-Tisochrysis_lutea.AAC.1
MELAVAGSADAGEPLSPLRKRRAMRKGNSEQREVPHSTTFDGQGPSHTPQSGMDTSLTRAHPRHGAIYT